jgi:serine/threonine-protein kinase
MELDELKEKWEEHDRKLDLSLRLNRRLLRDSYTVRARFALWRLAGMLALGSIVILAVIVALGRFIAVNWSAPRFVVPAMVLDMMAIAALAVFIAQMGLALTMDYSQPIAQIQKRLETVRKLRIRYVQAIFLTSTLTWAPIFIVVMKAALGVDVYRAFDTTWLVANVAIGLAILAIGLWLARKFGSRLASTAFGRQFLRDLAGYNLNAASRFISSIEEFERDDA